MKRRYTWFFGSAILGVLLFASEWKGSVSSAADQPASSYEAEKAKALANPYPNDAGPSSVDVSSYPKELQDTYKNLVLVKCARCHQPSRPLNSQFIEPSAAKNQHAAVIADWKKAHPEMFQDKLVWQIEPWTANQAGIWERYVKKMKAKPGCNISQEEAKKIWQFLTYDSEKRKTGANAAKWAEHRRKLLTDFKAQHPARYKELFETQ